MLTVHPRRWHDRPLPWMKELVWQNVKNVVKRRLAQRRKDAKGEMRQGLFFAAWRLCVRDGRLPGQVKITVHPRRWHDRPLPWMKELVLAVDM